MSPLWLFVIRCPFRLNHCICIMRNEGILHHKQNRKYPNVKVFVLPHAVLRFEPPFQYYSTTMTRVIAVLIIYLRIIFFWRNYFLYRGSFDEKSIGGSHGSLRPELAILEKIFSLPKIIFFLVFLFCRKDLQGLLCISFYMLFAKSKKFEAVKLFVGLYSYTSEITVILCIS